VYRQKVCRHWLHILCDSAYYVIIGRQLSRDAAFTVGLHLSMTFIEGGIRPRQILCVA